MLFLCPQELIPPIALNRHRISETHEPVTLIYFARSFSDKVIPEKEDDEWKWCNKEEINGLEPIAQDIAFYAKLALEIVKQEFKK